MTATTVSQPEILGSSQPQISLPSIGGENSKWSSGTIITVVLIIIVLALLGLNIFTYLAKGSDQLGYLVEVLTKNIPGSLRDVLSTSGRGVVLGTGVVGGAIQQAGDVVGREMEVQRADLWEGRDRGRPSALPSTKKADSKRYGPPKRTGAYQPDKTSSEIQKPHKAGFCYIGTDKGYRSCISVSESDKCLSGEIYPTMRLCINPTLRQ